MGETARGTRAERGQQTLPGTGTTLSTYDAQDRLTDAGLAHYDYTRAGELLAKTVGDERTEYHYDGFGSLRKVVKLAGQPGETTIDYTVDALGRRVAKSKDGVVERRWLYGTGLLPVAELAADGVTVAKRFGPGYVVTDPGTAAERTFRIFRDHLGSVRLVVDASSGVVAQEITYDAWGNATVVSGPQDLVVPFGYAGGLYDRDTGLVRFGARDYDPAVGRWTARDPIGFSGGDVNLYGYVGGDPVNGVDPSGLYGEDGGGWERHAESVQQMPLAERAVLASLGLGAAATGMALGTGLFGVGASANWAAGQFNIGVWVRGVGQIFHVGRHALSIPELLPWMTRAAAGAMRAGPTLHIGMGGLHIPASLLAEGFGLGLLLGTVLQVPGDVAVPAVPCPGAGGGAGGSGGAGGTP
ncbi:MAG: RHS repeat-associated core domain-containing protein [Polyangiaceae bacterium]|nr:RHS repeat-associated core domain-containing protein [Polyangiaceae bacterium]